MFVRQKKKKLMHSIIIQKLLEIFSITIGKHDKYMLEKINIFLANNDKYKMSLVGCTDSVNLLYTDIQ